jgi:hypothetical protein
MQISLTVQEILALSLDSISLLAKQGDLDWETQGAIKVLNPELLRAGALILREQSLQTPSCPAARKDYPIEYWENCFRGGPNLFGFQELLSKVRSIREQAQKVDSSGIPLMPEDHPFYSKGWIVGQTVSGALPSDVEGE